MRRNVMLSPAVFFAALAAGGGGHAQPNQELTLLSNGTSKLGMSEAIVVCERDHGLKINVEFAPNHVVKGKIEAGARFDVAAIDQTMAEELGARGLLTVTSITPVSKVGMALLAKAGAPALDIRDVEAFKRVLLNARGVSYSADGVSGETFLHNLADLGILEVMKPRLVPVANSFDGKLGILDGAAEYYAGPPVWVNPDIQFVAAFPAGIQTYQSVTAGISAHAAAPAAAATFVKCLRSPAVQAIFTAKGYVGAGE